MSPPAAADAATSYGFRQVRPWSTPSLKHYTVPLDELNRIQLASGSYCEQRNSKLIAFQAPRNARKDSPLRRLNPGAGLTTSKSKMPRAATSTERE